MTVDNIVYYEYVIIVCENVVVKKSADVNIIYYVRIGLAR